MEYRQLGGSGLKVSALSFGTSTFGGVGALFKAWGCTDVEEARRMIDICLEAGVNHFDTADVYSEGRAEEILGKAIGSKRNQLLISTKATFRLVRVQMMWARHATTCANLSKAACAA